MCKTKGSKESKTPTVSGRKAPTEVVGVLDGMAPSGGSPIHSDSNREDNLFKHLDQQIEKSIKRATAKLETLKMNTAYLASIVKNEHTTLCRR